MVFNRVRELLENQTPPVYECRHCGTTLDGDAEECPSCGATEIARYEV